MAGEGVVGVLKAVLGLDTAQFEDGAKKAVKVTESFGKRMLEVAGGIQIQKSLEQAGHALIGFGKNALDTADSLFKLSQRTGVPVEQLSGLKHAAELSDVSIEALARGFKNLQVEMAKAATGGVSEAASAFQFLGISIDELKKGNAQETFLKIADGVSRIGNETTKTAVSAAIFGKRFGPELIPLLNQGRKGIEETISSAQKLGLIISTETAKSAEQFNDRMKDLKAVLSGIALTALEPLAKGLAAVATRLVELVNSTGFVAKAAEGLVRAIILVTDNLRVLDQLLLVFLIKLSVQAVINFAAALISFARVMATATLAVALMNIASLVTVARFAALAAIIALATGNLPGFTDALERVGGQIAKMMPPETAKTITEGLQTVGINTSALTKELSALSLGFVDTDNAIDNVIQTMAKLDVLRKNALFDPDAAKRLQNFNEEMRKISLQSREISGEFTGRLAPGFIQAAQSLKLISEDGKNLEAILGLTTEQSRRLNDQLFKLNAARLTAEFQDPYQQYLDKLKEIEATLGNIPGKVEVMRAANIKAATEMVDSYGKGWQTIASNSASAFKTLAEGNKKYAGLAKAAAIGEATVNTFVAATKALTLGPILGPIAAAAITAAGLATVAKISATDFAMGGSFKVGGAGGIDSQLISMNLTPGEMVDVRKPGAQQPTSSREIVLTGMRPDEVFTGRWLRGFVDALNQGDRDGYKLRFAER